MIVVVGESLIDFIERASHGPNPTYEACPGGSPYNCALALGRLGADVGFLGPFSRDRLGMLMRNRLQAVGARSSRRRASGRRRSRSSAFRPTASRPTASTTRARPTGT